MSDTLIVACPHCHALNRVPATRLDDSGVCGKCKGALFTGAPVTLDETGFTRHAERADLPLLVDFWAAWCGPCRSMAPAFAESARRLEPRVRLGKVDTESQPELAARFAIRSIPTLILFRHGREVARQAGAMDAASIQRWVASQL